MQPDMQLDSERIADFKAAQDLVNPSTPGMIDTLCTGTTHPTCQACARRTWPACRLLDEGGRGQWISHVNPPINLSTGHCPELRAERGTAAPAE